MRIISGSAKGRTLASVPGDSTRPITDRVKSALFSILTSQERVAGCRFLDLFGGTGAVGIEALSRGATEVVFCERDRVALRVLRQNLEAAGVAERGIVIAGDAFAYLARPGLPTFDVIYIAPPQYQGLWLRALSGVDVRPALLSETGQVIVQVFPKEWREPGLVNLALADQRRYGSTALFFFARTE
ncbi:MAG: 16S rRNA (guanine(966)-N(2))-methyltransferase RsmD [Chloroflexi bacterium]|nr:16S rRNA (guanine(966)-N(2))-methyltransferase RsmD [Chloroflexota bacterium]